MEMKLYIAKARNEFSSFAQKKFNTQRSEHGHPPKGCHGKFLPVFALAVLLLVHLFNMVSLRRVL